MFNASCPQCGAPVEFKSSAAVMAVCSFCRSTLHKRGDEVRLTGRMANVFEDYSPLRIGAAGRFEGRGFSVVGRLQLRYDAGFWNEWFIWFDDGATGWLSDASGLYAVTERIDAPATKELPPFDLITPGRTFSFDGVKYAVSDVRTAECRGGEGELPMLVGDGWQARVADCRSDSLFLTLDFSDSRVPALYRGRALALDALAMSGLRDEQRIRESAGRYAGDVIAFACPNCGASLEHAAGIADYVYCPSCHAGVDCTDEQKQVFAAGREVEQFVTALALGAKGAFDGATYTIIGIMRCRSGGGAEWDEYLLHAAGRGFLWLVHSEGAWERVDVLNVWPEVESSDTVRLDKKRYDQRETYPSEVVQVIGAFNWRVRAGDAVTVHDFIGHGRKLTSETNAYEVVWSQAKAVPFRSIAEKFQLPVSAEAERKWLFTPLPLMFSVLLIVLRLPGYENFAPDGVMTLLGLVLLWVPEWIGRYFIRADWYENAGGSR